MKKILHFEDDEMLVELYQKKFKESGYDIKSFTRATKFPLDIVVQEKPDLILMNIIMPDMDGFSLTKLLKADERTKNIPIVALTTMGQEPDKDKGLELGMTEYLVKADNTPDQVVNKISSILK